MTYKVGDKVRVVNHLAGPMSEEMLREFGGKIVTISGAVQGCKPDVYFVADDTRKFVWYENCFTPISEPHDKFDWEEFKRGGVYVEFGSDNSAREFLNRCGKRGIKWQSGAKASVWWIGGKRVVVNKFSRLEYSDSEKPVHLEYKCYSWDKRRYVVSPDIEPRKSEPQDWTGGEISQAKSLSHELICKLFDAGCSVYWYKKGDSAFAADCYGDDDGEVVATLPSNVNPCWKNVSDFAYPSGDDVPNEWISKCVCLCRITNTKIPAFIMNKNRKDKK